MEKHPHQHQTDILTSKKTFFYNFLPSKAEEDHCRLTNRPYQVTKTIVEIRDVYPPQHDLTNPWRICRTLTFGEVMSGQMFITYNEAFDHVFRYWSVEVTTIAAVMGNKLSLQILDLTEESKPVSIDKCFFQKGCDEGYNLGILELVKSRSINPKDEIGLYWDPRFSAFMFKVLRWSSSQTLPVSSTST